MRYGGKYEDNNSIHGIGRKVPEISMHYLEFIFDDATKLTLWQASGERVNILWRGVALCGLDVMLFYFGLWILLAVCFFCSHREMDILLFRIAADAVNSLCEHSRELVALMRMRDSIVCPIVLSTNLLYCITGIVQKKEKKKKQHSVATF